MSSYTFAEEMLPETPTMSPVLKPVTATASCIGERTCGVLPCGTPQLQEQRPSYVNELSGTQTIAIAMAGTASSSAAEQRLGELLANPDTKEALLNEVVRSGVFSMFEHVARHYSHDEIVAAFRLAARIGRGDFAFRLLVNGGGFELATFVGFSMRPELLETAALSGSLAILQKFQQTWALGPADVTQGPAFDALARFCEASSVDAVTYVVDTFVLSEPPNDNEVVDGLGFFVGANPELGSSHLSRIVEAAVRYVSAKGSQALRRVRATKFISKVVRGATYAGKTNAIVELIHMCDGIERADCC
eukprot:m51a1_g5749 hypothetical protein (304) ;mRNA; r:1182518-1183429